MPTTKTLQMFPINRITLLLCAFVFTSTLGFAQTNLLANGDLENWTGGNLDEWVLQEGQVIQETSETSSGNSSVLFIETRNTTDPNIVSKNFLFEAGKTYRLSYDFKVKTGRVPFGQQVVGFKFGPVSSFPYSSGSAIPQGFDWESRDTEIEITVTEEWRLEVSAFTFIDELFEVYVDNVKVVDINQTNADRDALVAFYNATNGDNWSNSWDLNADISTWQGITWDTNNRVIGIDLKSNNLTGSLPPEIGNLTELQTLELNPLFITGTVRNTISGLIPPEIGQLQNLTTLNLQGNNFQGQLPSEIGQINSLINLDLSANQISGSIPSSLGNLQNLENLILSSNGFTGAIPSEIGQINTLVILDLARNEISGSIPSSIGNLINLEEIHLRSNDLVGTLPTEIGQMTSLVILDFSFNEISGSLPASIGNLINLERFGLIYNDITGTIPSEMGQLNSLLSLGISGNEITGNIPESLGNLTNLQEFLLNENNISGSIPDAISQLPNLTYFHVHGNNLSGNVPVFTVSNILGGNHSTLPGFRIEENNFVFEDIISSLSNQANASYSPQNVIGEVATIDVQEDENFTISVTNTNHTNNTYQWRKNGVNIPSATNSTFTIENVKSTDAGDYDCIITNTSLTELTLQKATITLSFEGNDADNDGVIDDNDNCPNTPTSETVDSNGCSQSQLDDDMDGVTNNNDNCPNTPTSETVDASGCSLSQLDDDSDGVTNNNDNCPNTPSGQSVDTNGCAQSQLDDDNDGVTNNNDTCPNTPVGETVDQFGCSQSQDLNIFNDDIQVKVTSTSCTNQSNGEIFVSFNKVYDYTVVISGQGTNETFTDLNLFTGLTISDLAAGSYSVCITLSEYQLFERCFTVVVETPDAFDSGKTVVDRIKKEGRMVVSGSKHYEVLVNGQKMEFDFSDTGRNELKFPLKDGANSIVTKTDKACQGEYAETVMLNSVRVFPNPTTDIATVIGLKNDQNASISILDMSGVLIKSYSENISNTSLEINIEDLPEGMYLVQINSTEQTVQTKVVKK